MTDRGDDIGDRLQAALAEGAAGAPEAGGLADRARARASTRRRTRARVVVGAAAVAMVLAVVPLALLGQGSPASVGGAAVGEGWRTVELTYEVTSPDAGSRRVLVDVPEAWTQTSGDCSLDLAADPGACDEGEGVSLIPDTGNQDFTFGPGVYAADDYGYPVDAAWSGYVTVGGTDGGTEGYLDVQSGVRQTALRVLGSVRGPGEDVADLSGAWPATVDRGVAWVSPGGVTAKVEEEPRSNGPRGAFGFRGFAGPERDGSYGALKEIGDQALHVVAPTRALAEVVAGSARPDDVTTPVQAWTTRTVDGVTLDVPPGWVRLDTGACRAGQTRFGPVGTEPCATPAPLSISGSELYDNSAPPGLDAGYVLVGDQVVTAEGDPDVVRRVLASAHVPGENPGDLDGAWDQRSDDGVTWAQPQGADVRVEASSGSTVSCAVGGPQFRAAPVAGGRWQAAYCGDGQATVVAPTQALADLVASTIEGGASSGLSGTEDWRTVVARDVTFDVPADWDAVGPCRDRADPVRFGPAGTDVCTQVPPIEVGGIDSPQALSAPGLRQGPSLVFAGRSMVLARGDLQTKRRVLASVRLVDDPVVDVSQWRTKVVGPFVADVPVSAAADVDLLQRPGVFDGVSYQPAIERDGVWVATTSPDTYRVVQVTAPTQALADLVASTVRG